MSEMTKTKFNEIIKNDNNKNVFCYYIPLFFLIHGCLRCMNITYCCEELKDRLIAVGPQGEAATSPPPTMHLGGFRAKGVSWCRKGAFLLP